MPTCVEVFVGSQKSRLGLAWEQRSRPCILSRAGALLPTVLESPWAGPPEKFGGDLYIHGLWGHQVVALCHCPLTSCSSDTGICMVHGWHRAGITCAPQGRKHRVSPEWSSSGFSDSSCTPPAAEPPVLGHGCACRVCGELDGSPGALLRREEEGSCSADRRPLF